MSNQIIEWFIIYIKCNQHYFYTKLHNKILIAGLRIFTPKMVFLNSIFKKVIESFFPIQLNNIDIYETGIEN